jgi:hypothetical protein
MPPRDSALVLLHREKPETGGTRLSLATMDGTPPTTLVHIEDVWKEVRALERQHFASSRYRRIGRTMEPVIDFFEKFSSALDTMVQYGASPVVLVWGSLKAVLVVYIHCNISPLHPARASKSRVRLLRPLSTTSTSSTMPW